MEPATTGHDVIGHDRWSVHHLARGAARLSHAARPAHRQLTLAARTQPDDRRHEMA